MGGDTRRMVWEFAVGGGGGAVGFAGVFSLRFLVLGFRCVALRRVVRMVVERCLGVVDWASRPRF
jgi:hypothetical protein